MPRDSSAFLASTELFGNLEPETLRQLGAEVERLRLPGGAHLFHQGDIADCMYVVVNGRLRITFEKPAGDIEVLGEVGRGETVGEMALLTGDRRSATGRAVRDTELFKLSQDAFDRLVERHPQLTMMLARRIVSRYQQAMRLTRGGGSRGKVTTIALVPTQREVPLSEFSHRLEESLAAHGGALRLNSDRVNAALGGDAATVPQDHSRDSEIASWLNEQEGSHRFIIYEADLVRSPWTSRCVRQADRLLLVGSDAVPPALGPIEAAMQRDGTDTAGAQRELVLLHREKRDLYLGTSEWLTPRTVDRHHHVALDTPADLARLVRLLTGTATGVVLGGGGARCFAQIGVLQAIEEAGIAIDLIGGTSMGAFLAAQYAMGWSPQRMHEHNKPYWKGGRPLSDYTLPYAGMITGHKFVNLARGMYGDANIEDLGIPFFCCSTNLTRATIMVHERGPIYRWLSASIAVPGVAPPLPDRGDLLVDGAVLDNLPIDVMRKRCDGSVIAVDVSPVEELYTDKAYSMVPSSLSLYYNRFSPFSKPLPVPSILEILSRVSSLGSVYAVESMKRLADVFFHPPIEKFSMFAFGQIDELVETGYRYAASALRERGPLKVGEPEKKPARVTTATPRHSRAV